MKYLPLIFSASLLLFLLSSVSSWTNQDCYASILSVSVIPAAEAGGYMFPDVAQSIPQDTATNFTITPIPGYHVTTVTGCGGAIAGKRYNTGVISSPCIITAKFANSYSAFNEQAYLAANTDVATALRDGKYGITSGWDHYIRGGWLEKRLLAPYDYGSFSEEAYLAANPDVATALRDGKYGITSGWDHYIHSGLMEKRRLMPYNYANFSEQAYLAANPEVAKAIKAGQFTSGWEHYEKWGRLSGLPLSPLHYGTFDEDAYLLANPDVAAAVNGGQVSSGWEHYEKWGRDNNLRTYPDGYVFFDEQAYLAANPAVVAAVKDGQFSSGWEHYEKWGRSAGSPLAPKDYANFSETAYLAANPDVAVAVKAGQFSSGWDHYNKWGKGATLPLNPPGYGSFKESDYLAANPDVFQALQNGLYGLVSGWDHFNRSGKQEGRIIAPVSLPTSLETSGQAIDLTRFFTCAAHQEYCTDAVTRFHTAEYFWQAGTIYNESILALLTADDSIPVFNLWEPIAHVVAVSHPQTGIVYTPGTDYRASNGQLIIPYGSSIPLGPADFTSIVDQNSDFASESKRMDGTPLRISNDYAQYQLAVTYQPTRLPTPPTVTNALPSLMSKLNAGQQVALTFWGDSITLGSNASSPMLQKPHQPPFTDLVGSLLSSRFGNIINWRAVGTQGLDSTMALSRSMDPYDAINVTASDVIIVAVGINDAELPLGKVEYEANITGLINQIRAKRPATEFVLVASSQGNADWYKMNSQAFADYLEAINSIASRFSGIAVADMTSPWGEMLQRVSYYDVTGNGCNHPADFGHVMYAQVIAHALAP